MKNKIIQRAVTKTLVPRITAAITNAPLINASIPAIIDNNPAANTSVTISKIATQDAFDELIPFLCNQ